MANILNHQGPRTRSTTTAKTIPPTKKSDGPEACSKVRLKSNPAPGQPTEL